MRRAGRKAARSEVRITRRRGVRRTYVWWDITCTAAGIRNEARAIKGVLRFNDLFGGLQFAIKVTINEPVGPDAIIRKEGVGFDYNQFIDSHRWVRITPLEDMDVVFVVEQVLFTDGSRWSAEK